MIVTSHRGTNANLIAAALALYPAKVIADLTYGRGVFWRMVDHADVELLAFDIDPSAGVTVADSRSLPLEDNSVDLAVVDPPYVHSPKKFHLDGAYRNDRTTTGMNHAAIMGLYADLMQEAGRISRHRVFVKCQDTIEWTRQKWSHIEVYDIARALGWYAKDLFILTPDGSPRRTRTDIGAGIQRHARRNHSYLWVFET